MTKEAKEPAKQYRVKIHSGEDKGDKGDVFLSHNFKPVLIQRDKEVVISERYVDVLRDSVIHTVQKNEEGEERPVTIPRFSFSVEPV